MNKKKYKNTYYKTREVTDLKDLLDQSAEIFKEKAAYMVKDKPGGPYRKIMYPEFKRDVDALGTSLLSMGLAGTKIAVVGENSYKWIVSYMAVACGVGVIVPLDRELPINEMAHLAKRAEISAIICSKKLEDKAMELLEEVDSLKYMIKMNAQVHNDQELEMDARIYSFDRLIDEGNVRIEEGNRSFINAEINPDEMCSLLFTSGTTGLAKGVMLSHTNIVQNTLNMSKYVDIGEDGVGLSVLPMHHTFEMTCHITTAMYQGLCVAICEGLKYIMKNMAESQATVMLGVPLIFEQMHKKLMKQAQQSGRLEKMKKGIALSKKFKLYNHPEVTKKMFAPLHEATGGKMRLFIAGGAAINPEVISDFEAMGIPMMQGYGMTENAPIIAVNRDRFSKADSVGFPMPGTEIEIIDQDENGIGEVICKGPSVMLGYFNNPEETNSVLIDGWLHTGDYGKFDSDGMLYIMGRKKNVIVTKNGKNIFPEEVEYYLLKSDFIEEALVVGTTDEKTGDTVVKASVYPNYKLIEEELGTYTKEELRQFIKNIIDVINEEMPLYKRVKRFSIRETEFEKTTTKKIKRFAKENLVDVD